MSGAGDSDTPSVRHSRNVRPPIGKSAGAPSALITASTSTGSFAGNRPKASPTSYSRPEDDRSNSTCQVSFAEPGLLSSLRERTVAFTGLSREVPGAAWAAAATTADSASADAGAEAAG